MYIYRLEANRKFICSILFCKIWKEVTNIKTYESLYIFICTYLNGKQKVKTLYLDFVKVFTGIWHFCAS